MLIKITDRETKQEQHYFFSSYEKTGKENFRKIKECIRDFISSEGYNFMWTNEYRALETDENYFLFYGYGYVPEPIQEPNEELFEYIRLRIEFIHYKYMPLE